MKNPKLYRELSEPFPSSEAAEAAYNAFLEELYELRKKHKIANVNFVLGISYVGAEGEEGEVFMPGHSIRSWPVTSWWWPTSAVPTSAWTPPLPGRGADPVTCSGQTWRRRPARSPSGPTCCSPR